MEMTLVCRSCLATNTKLYRFNSLLKQGYQMIRGCMDLKWDNMPQYICNFCGVVLLKFLAFKKKCDRAQDLLDEALVKNGVVTVDYCRNVDKSVHDLIVHFTIEEEKISIVPPNINEHSKFTRKNNLNIGQNSPIFTDIFAKLQPEPLDIKEHVYKTEDVCDSVLGDNLQRDFLNKSASLENEESVENTEFSFVCDNDTKCISSIDSKSVAMVDNNFIKIKTENPKTKDSMEYVNALNLNEIQIKGVNGMRESGMKTSLSNWSITVKPIKVNKKLKIKKKSNIKKFGGSYEIERHDVCELKHNNKRVTLTIEQQQEHMEARKNSESYLEARFKCGKCCKVYYTEQELECHMEVHNPCTQMFVTESSRDVHLKRLQSNPSRSQKSDHQKVIPREEVGFVCELCGKTMKAASMPYHQRIHTGERPYRCEHCPKTFVTKKNMPTHMRIHTGERPYRCDVCSKAFISSITLKQHKMVHKDERQFKCHLCEKAFRHPSNLRDHVKVVHMEIPRIRPKKEVRPVTCPLCGKTIKYAQNLQCHIDTVHRKIPLVRRKKQDKSIVEEASAKSSKRPRRTNTVLRKKT